MRVGPHLTIERDRVAGLVLTFQLTDGPHRRTANNRHEAVNIIERVLPGYLTSDLRRLVGDTLHCETQPERRTLVRRRADPAQAGVISGQVSLLLGEVVEADGMTTETEEERLSRIDDEEDDRIWRDGQRSPTTEAGISFADGEDDGLTDLIISIEEEAAAPWRAQVEAIRSNLADPDLSDAIIVDRVRRIVERTDA